MGSACCTYVRTYIRSHGYVVSMSVQEKMSGECCSNKSVGNERLHTQDKSAVGWPSPHPRPAALADRSYLVASGPMGPGTCPFVREGLFW